jgi:hypothetical protein
MTLRNHCCLLMLAVACCGLAGCQAAQMPSAVSQHLSSVRTEMGLGRASIVAVGMSLKGLRASDAADLKSEFKTYTDNLETLQAKAGGVGFVVDMQQSRTGAYFANWEKEIRQLEDDDLRDRGETRRAQATKSYDEVKARLASLRTSFQPYQSDLQDLRRSLTTDLTPAGLKVATPSIDKALDHQASVLKDLDGVIESIDRITRN